MLVESIMVADVETVPIDAALQRAVERMLRARVGSQLVTRDGDPVGIVTETDVLAAGYRREQPFAEIPVGEVMSHPLITTTPDATVRAAVEQMRTESIKKLPVVVDLDVVGIVTLTDVVSHHEEFIKEAHALESERSGWTDED